MDWAKFLKLLPVVAGAFNPAAGVAAQIIMDQAEKILADRAVSDPNFDRDAYLAQANIKWQEDIAKAEALRAKGN